MLTLVIFFVLFYTYLFFTYLSKPLPHQLKLFSFPNARVHFLLIPHRMPSARGPRCSEFFHCGLVLGAHNPHYNFFQTHELFNGVIWFPNVRVHFSWL